MQTKTGLSQYGGTIVDLFIPWLVCFLSCRMITDTSLVSALVFATLFTVVYFSGKECIIRFITQFVMISSVTLSNLLAIGSSMLIAVTLFLLADLFLNTPDAFALTVVFSSTLAFFILGTLSPLLKSDKHQH